MEEEMIVYLAVNTENGYVDRLWLEHDHRTLEDCSEHRLVEGWEWRPFKIVPAN
jgi:hypothetical protein